MNWTEKRCTQLYDMERVLRTIAYANNTNNFLIKMTEASEIAKHLLEDITGSLEPSDRSFTSFLKAIAMDDREKSRKSELTVDFSKIKFAEEEMYYIVDLRDEFVNKKYVTFWRANNSNYAWPISWAGKYSRSQILSNISYYIVKDGEGNLIRFPVLCEDLQLIGLSEPDKGDIDGNVGPVLRTSEHVLDKLRQYAQLRKHALPL